MRSRPRLLALTASLVVAAAPVAPISAQTFSGYFTFGDEVRIRADGAIGRFTVVEVRERALVLQSRYDDTTRLISVDAMRFLEISRDSYTRSQGAGRGLLRGAVVGAALGGFVGTVIGMTFPGTRWESIPVKTSHVRPGSTGRGLELGVGLRF
jgi:hypothetical protein